MAYYQLRNVTAEEIASCMLTRGQSVALVTADVFGPKEAELLYRELLSRKTPLEIRYSKADTMDNAYLFEVCNRWTWDRTYGA